MKIVCDSCGTKYSISDDKVRGKVFKIRCKKCSHIIVVRGTSDAAAAPAATEGVWHLVIDGDQVGPLPEAEIRGKLERGEINGDTYAWKEGFADWLKLSTIPELADALRGITPGSGEVIAEPAAPAGVNGDSSGRQSSSPSGLFGTVSAPATAADSDVFAAPAPAAARAAGGGDLFASTAARPAAEEPRWPTASHGGGGGAAHAAAAGHDGGRVENLTGQRHENSVLFSLANLQSLAMPSAAPRPIASTAPTSEGSGLIDIRSMAATTLGLPGGGDARPGGGNGDDLPAFGAFSPAAPVLLPLPGTSGPPKWVYPVIAVIVAAVAAIVIMAYKIVNVKPPTVIAEAPAAPAAAPAAAQPSAPIAAAAPTARPGTIADENLPPREAAGAPKPADSKGEAKSDKGERHHGGGHHGDKDKKGATEEKKGGGSVVAAAAAAPEPAERRPARGSLDDLLESATRSRGASARHDDDAPARKQQEAVAAAPLSKGAVVAGMNSVKGKIGECYNQYKVPGTALVNVVIGRNGKVSSAAVTGKFAGTPTGSCVEKAVKSAGFPPSSDGLTTPYPFQLK